MSGLMVPGIWTTLGGRRLLVPPLSLGALEILQDRLDDLPTLAITDRKAVATVIDAAHMALQRNYPAFTREDVAALIDVSNIGDVYECLMDVAGMRRKELGEGNQEAVSAQVGAVSSPSSAPTPDGPGPTSASTSTSPPSTP